MRLLPLVLGELTSVGWKELSTGAETFQHCSALQVGVGNKSGLLVGTWAGGSMRMCPFARNASCPASCP